MSKNVLLVDDQADILEVMSDYLEAVQYTVHIASDAEGALRTLDKEEIDIILLDVMMPGDNGFTLCKKIRKSSMIPILFLTARESDNDRIRGLTIGGDDYISKSSSPAEVVARVNAINRRQQHHLASINEKYNKSSCVEIDHLSLEISILGKKVDMSIIEFKLFSYLYHNVGNVLSYDQILEKVWKDDFYDPQIIRVYIAKLREKLAEYDQLFQIKNVRTVGYRMLMVTQDEE
ncbi:DNA-binding response OmpR family regulator [Alkalihalobacillus xiaoxiensis]|uniref:DNA-binding response OmpR family regulator n=1 Tax=Shouchella xiaoxiensis TaxID=766895 RepID=A0ABS2SY41_9BACI|nr:response regulator transcription factor [Shouchella xiaoxiensis]MBM7839349.1 DNA-binding response OmpR family regulator [Shouchella xiaoxiensis]